MAALLIVLCGLATYWSSFDGAFVFDDATLINKDNPHLRSIWSSFASIRSSQQATSVGRPVHALSLSINYALNGLDPRGYHLFNLLIHLAAGLTLLGIVRRTLLTRLLRQRMGRHALSLGFAVAVLWTLHPMHTKSVTYITQRAESMMGLFYLLTLYCAIRGMTSARKWWYAGAVGTCLLGVGSKEVIATVVLLAPLYDRIFISASWRDLIQRRWGFYLALTSTWVPLGFLMLSGPLGQDSGFNPSYISSFEFALTQCWAITRYLRTAILPLAHVFDYGEAVTASLLTRAQIISGAVVVAALLLATGLALRRWSPWGYLGAWFFVVLAPTSSVIPMPPEIATENRMYVPLAAVIALIVLGAFFLWERLTPAEGEPTARWTRIMPAVAVAAAAVAIGCLTVQRNKDFHDPMDLWNRSIRHWPLSARALTNRGNLHARDGRFDLAIQDYDRALKLIPDHVHALHTRAMILDRSGRHKQALAGYARTVEVTRQQRASGNSLVAAHVLDHLESEAFNGWAWILATNRDDKVRDGPKAVRLARQALALAKQNNSHVLDTLAAALAEVGQYGQAVVFAKKAMDAVQAGPSRAKLRDEYGGRLKAYQANKPHWE